MFGDLKKHDLDLESTILRHLIYFFRLTLAGAILYIGLISAGVKTIHAGLRHLVDRKKRRTLSIFQIGLRFIQRRLFTDFPFQLSLCSYL